MVERTGSARAGRSRRLWGDPQRVVVLCLLTLAAWALLVRYADRHQFFDLQVYDGAVRYWVLDHGAIYDYLKPFSQYGFTYPPFGAITMLPMAFLPWGVVTTLATAATVLCSLVVITWFVDPLIARQGWSRWYTIGVFCALAAVFEPVRETVLFGQVNLLLVALVTGDFLYGVLRGRKWGGVGIGLAAAIKLTPAIFILYLVITRRWRAAAVSTATAAVATIAAMVIAPNSSRVFFTEALWDTNRVGNLASVANQSLRGSIGRLNPFWFHPKIYLFVVAATLALWAWRVWRAAKQGDELLGFALTAVVGCLVSPVTWVHHLVWLVPALLLLVDRGFAAGGWRGRMLLVLAAGLYVLLCSRTIWHFSYGLNLRVMLGGNAYVLASLALLVLVPIARVDRAAPARSADPGHPHLGEVDEAGPVRKPLDPVQPVRDESAQLVKTARPVVVAEHP